MSSKNTLPRKGQRIELINGPHRGRTAVATGETINASGPGMVCDIEGGPYDGSTTVWPGDWRPTRP
ncbi:Uncharacterised protein [Mycobacteroides abscessus subsp. massiliense]|nr:Uncharacterised protein [Mycobacteroides abscessus subsp. massiliense]